MSRVPELIGWAISRYSPSAAFLLGIAINRPFSPSMTLISWITNSLSSVMDTIAFIFPSFSILLTRTSVTCIITSPICAPRRFYVITGQSIFECLSFSLCRTVRNIPSPNCGTLFTGYISRSSRSRSSHHPAFRYTSYSPGSYHGSQRCSSR